MHCAVCDHCAHLIEPNVDRLVVDKLTEGCSGEFAADQSFLPHSDAQRREPWGNSIVWAAPGEAACRENTPPCGSQAQNEEPHS